MHNCFINTLEANKQIGLSVPLKFNLAGIRSVFYSIFEHCLCIATISPWTFWVKFLFGFSRSWSGHKWGRINKGFVRD